MKVPEPAPIKIENTQSINLSQILTGVNLPEIRRELRKSLQPPSKTPLGNYIKSPILEEPPLKIAPAKTTGWTNAAKKRHLIAASMLE